MSSTVETGSGVKVAVAAAVMGLSYAVLLAVRRRRETEKEASQHLAEMEPDKMAKWWTPELKATWDRDGYVVLRGYLTQQELEILRAETERANEGFAWYPGFEGVRKNLHQGDPFFWGQLTRGAHRPILEGLLEDELVPAASGFFDKPPERSAVIEPHRDGNALMNGATMWIGLDDADESNGCIHYTPGSHLKGDPAGPEITAPEGRTGGKAVPVTAGDAIIHCSRCIHFSEKATKPKRRRAVNFFYWSSESVKKLEAAGGQVPGGRAMF